MKRITELRKEKNISQVSLAMKLNLSQKMISAYENGKSEPSIATLKNMADIFGTSVDYLIGYTDIRQSLDKLAQSNLTEDECVLLSRFRSLDKKNKYIAMGVILGLSHVE